MIALSPRTQSHVVTLFRVSDVAKVEDLLCRECGDALPMLGAAVTPENLERVRFAALRVSGGRFDRLREAISIAQRDWRDLLVEADFANDARAHEAWQPRRFDSAATERWFANDLPEGVAFEINHSVEIVSGPFRGKGGAVISLLGLEPEPRYLVELGSGQDVEAWQRVLKSAG
jgi:hypothetical protein